MFQVGTTTEPDCIQDIQGAHGEEIRKGGEEDFRHDGQNRRALKNWRTKGMRVFHSR